MDEDLPTLPIPLPASRTRPPIGPALLALAGLSAAVLGGGVSTLTTTAEATPVAAMTLAPLPPSTPADLTTTRPSAISVIWPED